MAFSESSPGFSCAIESETSSTVQIQATRMPILLQWSQCGTGWPISCVSENLEMNGQIALRVLADRQQQFACFHQHLVSVVIDGRIAQQFAGCALASFQTVHHL